MTEWPIIVIVSLYGLLALTMAAFKILCWKMRRTVRRMRAQNVINEAEWIVAYECIRLGIDNPDSER